MRTARRLWACHHEAGHALARWYFGHSSDRAVVLTTEAVKAARWACDAEGRPIETEGFVQGYCIHNPPWGAEYYSDSPERLRDAVINRDQHLIVLYAGIAADAAYRKMHGAVCVLGGGISDNKRITAILEGWYPDVSERAPAYDLAASRATALVRSRSGTAAIKAMATALMERGEIDGDEIEAMCRIAYGGRQPAFGSWDAHWPPSLADIRAGVIHEAELQAVA